MNLWSLGVATRSAVPERKSVLDAARSQRLYDDVERLSTSLQLLRQASFSGLRLILEPLPALEEMLRHLAEQLTMERGWGAFAASAHPVAPDAKWLAELRRLATISASGNVGSDQVAALVRDLFPAIRKLADDCLALYTEGKAQRLALPLLSSLKTVLALLEDFLAMERLDKELLRLRREVKQLEGVKAAFAGS